MRTQISFQIVNSLCLDQVKREIYNPQERTIKDLILELLFLYFYTFSKVYPFFMFPLKICGSFLLQGLFSGQIRLSKAFMIQFLAKECTCRI